MFRILNLPPSMGQTKQYKHISGLNLQLKVPTDFRISVVTAATLCNMDLLGYDINFDVCRLCNHINYCIIG